MKRAFATTAGREHDSCGIGFVAHLRGEASHRIVELALEALANHAHRGAVSPDGASGDGVGVLVQLPREFLAERFELADPGIESDSQQLAAGMFFWPPGSDREARALVEEELGGLGFETIGWREVPTRPELLGEAARRSCPAVRQALVRCPDELDAEAIERRLYRGRRRIERRCRAARQTADGDAAGLGGLVVVSLSHRTLVYKALCLASRLGDFYPDLGDPSLTSGLALFHQRFSTNTAATWRLAQPFRFLAHNGEINTVRGNVNWMTARERELVAAAGEERVDVLPVLEEGGSDSALLDNALEFLVRGGRDPLHAAMMLIPEAPRPGREPRREAFFDYHAGLMEPWDGPAAVVFTDGRIAAALLDRNGLRPQRWWRTDDDLVVLGSETGIVDVPDERIVEKGRLGPGEVLAVDTESGELLLDGAIKRRYARRRPYGEWLRRHRLEPPPLDPRPPRPERDEGALLRTQAMFGYSQEVFDSILDPMMESGKPPLASMGNDAPPAVLSQQPQLVYAYFRQRFAQVTNPAIDSLRERAVFSLETLAGAWGSPLGEKPEAAALIRLSTPVLRTEQLDWLRRLDDERFRSAELPTLYEVRRGGDGLRDVLERLCEEAEAAVDEAAALIVLTDRGSGPGRAPIPMLLATGAVHHHLVRRRKRMQVSLVCDTGEPREDHHVACLIGFGATLVHPWLVYRTLAHRAAEAGLDPLQAIDRYLAALEISLLKIMGKLGVCAITSYQGAQLFEAIGLDDEVIAACFPGTPCRIGGAGWDTLAESMARFHRQACPDAGPPGMPDRGRFRFRRGGEHHALNPRVFTSLHKAADAGDEASYRRFADAAEGGPPSSFRDLLEWRRADRPLELDAVEPAAEIVRRFSTAAMSHGALSREAHETLAIAMNRLGGRSNSGEGGEDPGRFVPYDEDRRPRWLGKWRPRAGDWGNSAIKQIASGRFGVTAHYLVSAREIEIKIAQGSKPGEGGEIPGHKVTAEIASQRRSGAGRTLISPPPHHDIYSIEDLAQLIYDLRRVHPEARIGVKLVAGTGVGTIAVGVTKAYADYVQISGDCGGTGASALSSIKHAGLPWELGLAETQRALVESGLRGRVALRVDGGLKTGRDVVLAALLGADEMGFGTAPLIAMGCIMARQCHLNTCPVGIATQDEKLRRKFTGRPEQVEAYLLGIAAQVRTVLAEMGFARLEEIVGRVDLLGRREREDGIGAGVDLAELLAEPARNGSGSPPARRRLQPRNPRPEERPPLDERVWQACRPAVLEGGRFQASFPIRNSERTVGARTAGGIARHTAGAGLEEGSITLDFEGVAGQSFGAFAVSGMTLRLSGEAQDYAGKGMSGGEVILRPPQPRRLASDRHVIAGNTLLYGATGGTCFAAGRVGERFAVRNSGTTAVVEGCGDYGCEYMTGGVVVVLGPVGRSFGAGMTGGVAFVLDRSGVLERRLDATRVCAEPLTSGEDATLLWRLVYRHADATGSGLAHRLLGEWRRALAGFRKVVPLEDAAYAAAGPVEKTQAAGGRASASVR